MCRMIDELLKIYRARQQATRYLTDIVKRPAIIDTLFESFTAENDFNAAVETLLSQLQTTSEEHNKTKNYADKFLSFYRLGHR